MDLHNGFPVETYNDIAMLAMAVALTAVITLLICCIVKRFTAQSIQLKKKEQFYQSLFQHNPDIVITFDLEGHILSANRVVKSYGYTEEELLRRSFTLYVVPDQLEKTIQNFRAAVKGKAINYETAIYTKHGDRRELHVTNIPIQVDGEVVGIYGIIKDITSLKQAQIDLVEAESKYRSLIEDSLVGVYIIQDGRYVFVNPQFVKMLEYSCQELLGADISHFIHPEDWPMIKENMAKRLSGEVPSARYQYRGIRKDQSVIHLEVHGSQTFYKGNAAIIGSVIDMTEQKKAEAKIQHMAYHDALTGLPNRYHFSDHFQAAISKQSIQKQSIKKQSIQKQSIQKAAILFFDLDRFKLINDSLGHDLGDLLLKEVAQRVKSCIRAKDFLARHGGDEFILFLPDLDQEGAANTAKQILGELNQPFHMDHYEMFITPSMGISLYPQDGEDIGVLIKKADLALYQAKRMGKNNFQFYGNESWEQTNEKFEWEKDLRKALEREEFVLYYQPKLNIHTGRLIGLEALIRWKHPEKGLISPAQFIPLAEETGLIIPIGEWVLKQACAQNKDWQEKGFPHVMISLNLSLRQFFQPNLIQMVSEVLQDTGLSADYLELEITESMMIDTHHALTMVKELKKLGVKISLDDFGTGYSSLHYLKEFPIDKLKIDQSFICHCLTDANDATIVKTMIAMAHQLKLEVIAEGVETKEQLIFLQQNLCDEVQGYLFSPPLPIEELEKKYHEIEQLVSRLGIPEEIRDQKWMEEELRVAQQELQETVRQQQGMTFKFKEQDGKFIHTLCDGELLYRMDLVPELVIGRDLHDIFPAEIADRKREFYQKAWNGEEHVSYEGECGGIWYLASLRPIRRGGQVVEVIGSCVDISERKRVEEALTCSEAKYRLIAEHMTELIAVVDIKTGMLQYASPSYQTVLGFSPMELEGSTGDHLIHPDDLHEVQKRFMAIRSAEKIPAIEFRHLHADGHWIPFEAQGTPVLGETGEVEKVVIVARDMTERKRAEQLVLDETF